MYSGKHKLYCLKSEVSHAPKSGVAMRISSGHPGARHDFEIYRQNVHGWIKKLRKTPEEREQTGDPPYWLQLADKGYQGAHHIPRVRMVTPHKPAPRQRLTSTQIAENRRIALARIVAENFYGRLKLIWGIMRNRWRGDRARYATTFGNCVALTNYHILNGNPLRREEICWYRAHQTKLRREEEAKRVPCKPQTPPRSAPSLFLLLSSLTTASCGHTNLFRFYSVLS